jgi:hypothetical protein
MTIGRRSIAATPKTQTINVAKIQVVAPVMTSLLEMSEVTNNDTKIATKEMPPISTLAEEVR